MATRITGLLHARSVRDLSSGAVEETTELDFNIQTGLMQGLEIAAVQGMMDIIPDFAAGMSRASAIQWLDPDGDNPVVPQLQVGDGDSFEADVDDRYIQRFNAYGAEDTTNHDTTVTVQIQPEGLWVPPRQILLARNPAHGIDKIGTTSTGMAILDIWYYWVRLHDSDLRGILSTMG